MEEGIDKVTKRGDAETKKPTSSERNRGGGELCQCPENNEGR